MTRGTKTTARPDDRSVCIRMTRDLWARVQRAAEADGRTVSGLVRVLLSRHLEKVERSETADTTLAATRYEPTGEESER